MEKKIFFSSFKAQNICVNLKFLKLLVFQKHREVNNCQVSIVAQYILYQPHQYEIARPVNVRREGEYLWGAL